VKLEGQVDFHQHQAARSRVAFFFIFSVAAADSSFAAPDFNAPLARLERTIFAPTRYEGGAAATIARLEPRMPELQSRQDICRRSGGGPA
jgi:hypothetical protein